MKTPIVKSSNPAIKFEVPKPSPKRLEKVFKVADTMLEYKKPEIFNPIANKKRIIKFIQ